MWTRISKTKALANGWETPSDAHPDSSYYYEGQKGEKLTVTAFPHVVYILHKEGNLLREKTYCLLKKGFGGSWASALAAVKKDLATGHAYDLLSIVRK